MPHLIIKVLFVASLTTAFDYILEPVAISLGYWTWHTAGIPGQNYLAWFLIALSSAVLFKVLKVKV